MVLKLSDSNSILFQEEKWYVVEYLIQRFYGLFLLQSGEEKTSQ